MKLLACGCAGRHTAYQSEPCLVHDEHGKRWDTYTLEQVLGLNSVIGVQTETTEWCCYCGKHKDDLMAPGTRCVWEKTSYEYDEWECHCEASYMQDWLDTVTMDWYAMAQEETPE